MESTGLGEHTMFPLMGLVMAAVGALVGVNIGRGGGWFFDAAVGAFIGIAIAELTRVRGRLLTLEEDVAKLRAMLKRRDTGASSIPTLTDTLEPAADLAPPLVQMSAAAPAPIEHAAPIKHAVPIEHAAPTARAAPIAPAAPTASGWTGLWRDLGMKLDESDFPLLNLMRRFFLGGNTLIRAGVIVLFFGGGFFIALRGRAYTGAD